MKKELKCFGVLLKQYMLYRRVVLHRNIPFVKLSVCRLRRIWDICHCLLHCFQECGSCLRRGIFLPEISMKSIWLHCEQNAPWKSWAAGLSVLILWWVLTLLTKVICLCPSKIWWTNKAFLEGCFNQWYFWKCFVFTNGVAWTGIYPGITENDVCWATSECTEGGDRTVYTWCF